MPDRRRVLQTLAGLFLSAFGLGSYAYAWEPAHQGVTRYRVKPAGWPEGRTLRLAAISDLHVGGPHVPVSRVREIVDQTNLLEPDLTLLLGDFIASRAKRPDDPPEAAWASELARLRAADGRFAILGNHDWWHDDRAQRDYRGPTEVRLALEAVGIPVLENDALRLETRAGPLWVAGLGDQLAFLRPRRGQRRGIHDLAGTLAKIDDDAPVVMMAHEPDIFARMPARVSLTLSGHTHGGQVRILGWSPIVPSHYGNRYAYGHVVENGRNLIVSGGVGTSKLPVRLGVPPEIVLVELG
ncbi:metallophosphoesterase [Bosea sp. WAO]|uniref:metallophosphoesterase n=1 Tax=Bosea sp. WAO TaxID=406341 RepID=UPI00074A5DBB|nr:metallophosphoesterase [Bosea sp. WAO]KUL94045.1 metallophosphoesterase [Bosea sp. WAO]